MMTTIHAQNKSNYKAEILSVLNDKHMYERNASPHIKEKKIDYKARYTNSFATLKYDKVILSYLDKAIQENKEELEKETVWYNYQDPLNSHVDFKNRISLLKFYQILSYSIESKKDVLPNLSQINLSH